MNFFSKNLKYLRKKGHLSQADLAKKVDKKQNTIGNWENQVTEPGIDELSILSQLFEVNLQDLIAANLEELESSRIGMPEELPKSPKYPVNESSSTMAREDSQDQFWVVVRELRRIHKKLDYMIGKNENKPDRPVQNKSSL